MNAGDGQIRGPVGPVAGATCDLCPFSANGQPTTPVPGIGPDAPDWILVGEGPGSSEQRWLQPFVGPTGQIVNRALEETGVPRRRIYLTNVTSCRPTAGKTSEAYREAAAAACRPRLNAELALFPGRPILAAGGVAARELLRGTSQLTKITDLTGTYHEVNIDGTGARPLIPTVHPAAMLRGMRGGDGEGNKDKTSGHTSDTGYWALKYDTLKVKALGQGKKIQLKLADSIDYELESAGRANKIVREILGEILVGGFGALDLETTVDDEQRNWALQAWAAKIVLIGLATKTRAVSVPWALLDRTTVGMIKATVCHNAVSWVFHNVAYDTAVLQNPRYQFPLVKSWAKRPDVHDTLLMDHAAFPGAPHNLQAVTSRFFAVRPWKAEFRDGDETPVEAAIYNASDTLSTAKLVAPLQILVKKTNTDKVYDVDRTMAVLAGRMHLWGYKVDRDVNAEMKSRLGAAVELQRHRIVRDFEGMRDRVLDKLAREMAIKMRKKDPVDYMDRVNLRRAEIQKEIDKGRWEFSPSNDNHVVSLLKCQGVPLYKHTKSGKTSTKADVLEGVAHYPAVAALLRYRENNILLRTFVARMWEWTQDSNKKWRPPFVQDDGRVHPIWSVNKISGRWGSVAPACFDPKTEILTQRGWVHFPDLRDDDLVAQYDGETAAIDFVAPVKLHRYHHVGEMVRWAGRYVDQLVTPNHRIPLLDRKRPELPLRVVEASDLRTGLDRALPTSGWKRDGEHVLPAFVRFIVAAQADGSTSGEKSWTFRFTRQRKIDRMRALLTDLGIVWTESVEEKPTNLTDGDLRRRTIFTLHHNAWTARARDLLGARKEFGSWLFTWDGASLDVFLDELMHWDGSFTTGRTYSSSNRTNADYVQAVAHLRGKFARVRAYNGSALQTKPNWQVDIRDRQRVQTSSFTAERVAYVGDVYCVTVPTGFVVVRRGQTVCISGNSQNWSEGDETNADPERQLPNLRRQVVAPPGRIIVGFDLEQLEARLMALQSGDEFLCRVFAEGLDIHAEFAKILFPQFAKLEKGSPDWNRLRTTTKRFEYGALYGGSDETVWKSIVVDEPSITLAMVRVAIMKVKQAVGGLLKWQQRLYEEVCKPPYTLRSYILGRMRVFPLGNPPSTDVANNPNQFAGADVMNLGMMNMLPKLDKYIKRGEFTCFPLKQVHDASYFECDEADADRVARDIYDSWTQEFTAANGQVIPFPIELKMGYALHSEPSDKDKEKHPQLIWPVGREGLRKVKLKVAS